MATADERIKSFSCATKITRDKYNFTINTGNISDRNIIISEIFKEGQYVSQRQLNYQVRQSENREIRYEYLSEVARRFHMEMAEKLEVLFTISHKIEKKGIYQAHYQLAVIFLNLHFLEEAEKHFKLAIKEKTDFLRAHFGLSVIYLMREEYKNVLIILNNLRDISNQFPDYHNLLGITYTLMGDYTKAIGEFKEAIRLNPDYTEVHLNLGIALYFSALQGVENEKAIGVPARISIYLKKLFNRQKYQNFYWKKRIMELLEIIKSQNHQVLKHELSKFLLETAMLYSEKDKIFEFFLRFVYGGKEITLSVAEEYEEEFHQLLEKYKNYPDVWNDVAIFQMIQARIYLIKAMKAFQNAMVKNSEDKEPEEIFQMLKTREKGLLLLLRALLKNSSM